MMDILISAHVDEEGSVMVIMAFVDDNTSSTTLLLFLLAEELGAVDATLFGRDRRADIE